MMNKLNPTVKEFLAQKPDVTLLGLWWSGYWRWVVIVMGISLALMIIGGIFG